MTYIHGIISRALDLCNLRQSSRLSLSASMMRGRSTPTTGKCYLPQTHIVARIASVADKGVGFNGLETANELPCLTYT